MKTRGALIVLMALACVAGTPAGPDRAVVKQVQDLTAEGVKEFQAGNAAKAIDLLQQAIAVVQKTLTANLKSFLPKAPDGWTGGKIEEQAFASTGAGLGQWNQVEQTFTKTAETDLKVEVRITNSPMLVQMQKGMWASYQNPMVLQMMNKDPNHQISLIDRDGWNGFMTLEKGKSVQASIFTSGGLIVVEVSKDKVDVFNQFLGLVNLKAAAKSLTSTPAMKTE